MAKRTRPTCPATFARAAPRPAERGRRGGFTLAELLIVIGIIALLVSILIPVASRVRIAGQSTDTSALIRAIDGACQQYYADHGAWPGVFPDDEIGLGTTAQFNDAGTPANVVVEAGSTHAGNGTDLENVTGTENLVLALQGGLRYGTTPGPNAGKLVFDPAAVGRGPVRLGGRNPGGSAPYLDLPPSSYSTHSAGDPDVNYAGLLPADAGKVSGRFVQDGTAAQDSLVPEFVDRFTDPLPILYLRAGSAGRITPTKVSGTPPPNGTNGKVIITDVPTGVNAIPGVFNQLHIEGYVGPTLPTGGPEAKFLSAGADPDRPYKRNGADVAIADPTEGYQHGLRLRPELTLDTDGNTAVVELRDSMIRGAANEFYPFDARAYFISPTAVEARQGDRYVLISAGPDRVYGTQDDITNFGPVMP